jgi:hypothetical protein
LRPLATAYKVRGLFGNLSIFNHHLIFISEEHYLWAEAIAEPARAKFGVAVMAIHVQDAPKRRADLVASGV